MNRLKEREKLNKLESKQTKPGIRCKWASIAGELKVGKCDELGNIKECGIIVSFGCFVLSQFGTCPFVTI